MWKISFLITFFLLLHVSSYSQSVNIECEIKDAFLNTPLDGVKISILNTDSTIVLDSVPTLNIIGSDGKIFKTIFIAEVDASKHKYIIRATKPGYGKVFQLVSIGTTQSGQVVVPDIKMRKERNINLDEVVVKATKVKMYYKGDTLIYNADAFKLPDGSMLDALIRQLPGVTMNENGEIFVNGRKVDELLLGSRSFMSGNKKVLMENLPYYT